MNREAQLLRLQALAHNLWPGRDCYGLEPHANNENTLAWIEDEQAMPLVTCRGPDALSELERELAARLGRRDAQEPDAQQLRTVGRMLDEALPRMLNALKQQRTGPRVVDDLDYALDAMCKVSAWLLKQADRREREGLHAAQES